MEVEFKELFSYPNYENNLDEFLGMIVEYDRWQYAGIESLNPEVFQHAIGPLDKLLESYDQIESAGKFGEDRMDGIRKSYEKGAWRWMVYYDSKIAGMIDLTRRSENEAEIHSVYIRPQFRGKKLARKLLERLIKKARDEKFETIYLLTFPFMGSAINLYESFGFRKREFIHLGVPEDFYNLFRGICMELRL